MKLKRILCSLYFFLLNIKYHIIVMIKNEVDNWGVASMTMEEDA